MKLFILLFSLFLSLLCGAQSTKTCFESHSIDSKALNEERSIWVGLPENYDSSRSYPVVYVLDAEHRFEITYSLTKELFENQSATPELIVVGIPHIDRNHRVNDLSFTDSKVSATGKKDTIGYFNASITGNGHSFLSFLENEAVPFINKHYNTNNFNTLVGHSLGGYFCAYILPIQKAFSAFQIYDPSIWFNDGDVLKQLRKGLKPNSKSHVFVSKGTAYDGPREHVDHHLAMIDSLRDLLREYPSMNSSSAAYEKNHNAMFFYSVIDGLSALFKDTEYGFISWSEPITLEKYENFYKAASKRLGATFTPPMDGVRWVAYANYRQENWEEALKAYEYCYSQFKNDMIVNMEIAECHKMLGNERKSSQFRKKVKALEEK